MDLRTPEIVTMNLRKIAIQHRISGQLLDDLRLEARTDYLQFAAEEMILALASRAQCHNLPPETVTETGHLTTREPSTWWQMLKRDHAPKWWLKRWPVRYDQTIHRLEVTVRLERFHVYPDAPTISHDGYQLVVPNHSISSWATWITGEDGS